MLVKMNCANGGGVSLPQFSTVENGVIPASNTKTITLDPSKNYLLFWDLRSTDGTASYTGLFTLFNNELTTVYFPNTAGSNITYNTTTHLLSIQNTSGSTRSDYLLAELS